MKIKRTVCFLLALVMLLRLLAGCGEQSGETTPVSGTENQTIPPETTQTTESEVKDPPRTAEEFVPRLNAELKAQNIPLEFVYHGEFPTQICDESGAVIDSFYGLYLAAFTDSGEPVTTERLDLSVDYINDPSEPMHKMTIWLYDNATEREREMHKTVCAIAAQLCDTQMTQETAEKLLTKEPSRTEYIRRDGEIGSLMLYEISKNAPGYSHSDVSVVYCQPYDLTHVLFREIDSRMECYEIYFTQAGEQLYADEEIPLVTVAELEAGLNAWLTEAGLPIECAFQRAGRYDNFPYEYGFVDDPEYNVGDMYWKCYFRFTNFDDPDFPYPDPYMASWMSKTDSQRNRVLNYAEITLKTKEHYSSAPIYAIEVGINTVNSYPQVLLPDLIQGICTVWDENTGEDTLSAFVSSAQTTQSEEEYCLVTEQYSLNYDYSEYDDIPPMPRFCVEYTPVSEGVLQSPADMLDPVLLDCQYTFSDSFVRDGVFSYNVHPTGIFTADMGIDEGDETHPSDLLVRYLCSTGSDKYNVNLEYGWEVPSLGELMDLSGETQTDFEIALYPGHEILLYEQYNDETEEYEPVDCGSFGTLIYSFDELKPNNYQQMYAVYYNESVESQVDPVDAIRLAVGLGQILDESLTVEDAIAMQKKEMTPTASYGDWEGVSFCPGEVMHIICQNTVTGQTVYFTLPKGLFETYYMDLESFMTDGYTLLYFELLSTYYS